MGPSWPALPPEAMVAMAVSPLTRGTRGRMRPAFWWKALIMASVPSVAPSMASGMNRVARNPVISPTAVVKTGMSQGR